jgi:glycosyltransferase involved in cell wall biosynthesis
LKSRILFILHLPPPVHGASVMGSYIKQSTLINSEFDTQYINLSSSNNLQQIGKGGIKKGYQLVKVLLNIIRALLFEKYDLAYVTLTARGVGFYKDVLVVGILKLFKKKIIYHFHNKGISTAKENSLNKMLYSFVFSNTKSILISESLYPDFKKYLHIEDVYFCPNGIPVTENIASSGIKPNPDHKLLSFLFLSNMMVEKGVFDLLDACEILNNRGLKFRCNFVGSWSDISEVVFLEEVKKRKLENIISSHGGKYGKEKDALFEEADVFVFPTYYHYESFPVVILEAMQFGLPVISTFEGGIPDEVLNGHTGFLVAQRNVKDLASKMELFIEKPEIGLKMGIAGRDRFKNNFTIDHFQNNLAKILTMAVHG